MSLMSISLFISLLAILTRLPRHCSCANDKDLFSDIDDAKFESLFPHFRFSNLTAPNPNAIRAPSNYTIDLEKLNEKLVMENMIKVQNEIARKHGQNFTNDDTDDDIVDEVFNKRPPDEKDRVMSNSTKDQFRKKKEVELEKMVEYIEDTYEDLMKNDPSFNVSRRRAFDDHKHLYVASNHTETRRQVPYYPNGYFDNQETPRRHAYKIYSKLRILDVMVQLIYMAQHKIRDLEKRKELKTKDTVYRIITIYTQLQTKLNKMQYFFTASKHEHTAWFTLPWIRLHHRIIKTYTDFNYLWWVLVRLHEKYCELNNISQVTYPLSTPAWTTTPWEYASFSGEVIKA